MTQLIVAVREQEDVEHAMFVENASTQHKKCNDKGDAVTPDARNDVGNTCHPEKRLEKREKRWRYATRLGKG